MAKRIHPFYELHRGAMEAAMRQRLVSNQRQLHLAPSRRKRAFKSALMPITAASPGLSPSR